MNSKTQSFQVKNKQLIIIFIKYIVRINISFLISVLSKAKQKY